MDDFNLFADALRGVCGLELSWLDSDKKIAGLGEAKTLLEDKALNIKALFKHSGVYRRLCERPDLPAMTADPMNCFWFAVPSGEGAYIAGPALVAPADSGKAAQYYMNQGFKTEEALSIAKEYEKMPVISVQTLFGHYRMIYHLVTGKSITITELSVFAIKDRAPLVYSEEEICAMQQRNFNAARKTELFLIECVAQGRPEKFSTLEMVGEKDISALALNELRSLKNNLIICVTLAGRAAIEGGLPVETVFPLTDMYILQIEAAVDSARLIEINQCMLGDLASRVKDAKFKLKYSKVVNKCCGYIAANARNPLQAKDVAKIVGMHPDSLSRKFKAETGVSLPDYIREAKVDEAKSLLRHTDMPLAMVSEHLGFSSQSQFIVSFRRVTGFTPKEYRLAGKG
jgi:AraC-like DNA-binding protein